jgi:hypothetical protein
VTPGNAAEIPDEWHLASIMLDDKLINIMGHIIKYEPHSWNLLLSRVTFMFSTSTIEALVEHHQRICTCMLLPVLYLTQQLLHLASRVRYG